MNLTSENYFSPEMNMRYMGSTQFKNFMQCEAAAMSKLREEYRPEPTKAMLVGSYIDAHFSGELDLFTAQHPEIISTRGANAGNLKSEYLEANDIIRRIERDEYFTSLLSGEPQKIMTGIIGGVEFKIKIDSCLPDISVDLKIMRDTHDLWQDGEYKPFWAAWGYDLQAAIYQTVRAQNDGAVKPFMLAVATKEAEPSIELYQFSQETINDALHIVEAYAPRFAAIKRGDIEPTKCGDCDFCRYERVLTEKDIKII